MTGYSRAQFGPAWTDNTAAPLGHDGCDTRNNILARDLSGIRFRSGHCVVVSGVLHDPYSGTTISFIRGNNTSTAVQIDHVVALGDAWQTGAQQLAPAQRAMYANDPGVLLAVDGALNEQKSDADAASWLPPNKSYRCFYVARQVAIKIKYQLWMTSAERATVARVLAGCPAQPLPAIGARITPVVGGASPHTGSVTPSVTPSASLAPTTAATTAATRSNPVAPSSSVYYANCAAARAAGVTPLHRGDPGYRPGLDRDADGVACE